MFIVTSYSCKSSSWTLTIDESVISKRLSTIEERGVMSSSKKRSRIDTSTTMCNSGCHDKVSTAVDTSKSKTSRCSNFRKERDFTYNNNNKFVRCCCCCGPTNTERFPMLKELLQKYFVIANSQSRIHQSTLLNSPEQRNSQPGSPQRRETLHTIKERRERSAPYGNMYTASSYLVKILLLLILLLQHLDLLHAWVNHNIYIGNSYNNLVQYNKYYGLLQRSFSGRKVLSNAEIFSTSTSSTEQLLCNYDDIDASNRSGILSQHHFNNNTDQNTDGNFNVNDNNVSLLMDHTMSDTTGVEHDYDDDDNNVDSESFWVQQPLEGSVSQDDDYIYSSEYDIPRLTENGGYSHTTASRAKISAANKGKVPWNKGLNRTDEVKARIAAGVRAKNRERFLEKLQSMGISEDEYEEQKRMERSKKEAERRARRTEKGGYRPTDETKRKISEILKQKFAKGEIKPRPVDPTHVRRGFTHSEETRQKISDSLRKRWATDPEYRAKMIDMSNRVNTKDEIRSKISQSLRNKWQTDDTFRNDMMNKIAARKQRVENADGTIDVVHHDTNHRAKISAAMKAKWQDATYRDKTLQSLAARRTASASNSTSSDSNIKAIPVSKKSKAIPSSMKATSTNKNNANTQKQTPVSINMEKNDIQSLVPKQKSKKNEHESNNDDIVIVRPLQPLTTPQKKIVKKATSTATQQHNLISNSGTLKPKTKSTIHSSTNHNDVVDNFATKIRPKSNYLERTNNMKLDLNDMTIDLLPDIVPDSLQSSHAATLEADVKLVTSSSSSSSSSAETAPTNVGTTANNAGSRELLKAERRDLYDLLYGDDDDEEYDNDTDSDDTIFVDKDSFVDYPTYNPMKGVTATTPTTSSSSTTATKLPIHLEDYMMDDNNNDSIHKYNTNHATTMASIYARLEDENLDTFDPYGLDDF